MKCLSATKIITQARGNFKDLGLTNLLNKSKLPQVEAFSEHCEISEGFLTAPGSKTGSFWFRSPALFAGENEDRQGSRVRVGRQQPAGLLHKVLTVLLQNVILIQYKYQLDKINFRTC